MADPVHPKAFEQTVRLIAFYLPQFHPIPENDEWWGPGFTEWNNVRSAGPGFRTHHQPRVPGQLGYYDLRSPETRQAQAKLAAEHGIHGFCYYHYWFNGKQLLDLPFSEVLDSGSPDFPFCLCWANENWTRAWDGLEREILIAQDYETYDVEQHVDSLVPAFLDHRYIRVDGKPLFLIYRADQIPDLSRVVERFRQRADRNGIPELHLCAVRNTQYALSPAETLASGFDAMVDFQPNSRQLSLYKKTSVEMARRLIAELLDMLGHPSASALRRINYERFVEAVMTTPRPEEKTYPCVFPGWDNSARRSTGATIIQNDSPGDFGRFLDHAIRQVGDFPGEEQLVFINAWNEWAEGCYLEPDQRHDLAFLRQVLEAVQGGRAS